MEIEPKPPPPPSEPPQRRYEQPYPPQPPRQVDPGEVRTMVMIPAVIMAVLSVMGIMYYLFTLVSMGSVSSAEMDQLMDMYRQMGVSEDEARQTQELANRISKPITFMFLVSQCLILASSISMLRLRGWNISVAGAIVAIIPCFSGICCLLQLPMGIWMLIVLLNERVKTVFQ